MSYLDKNGLAYLWGKIKGYVDNCLGDGVVQWEDVNGRPDLSTVSSMKVAQIVLWPALWDENNQQTVSVPGVLKNENQQLIVPVPKENSKAAYYNADIKCVEQGEDKLIFYCQKVPDEDLRVNVFIFGAAYVGEEYVGEFTWWSPQMTSETTPYPYIVTGSPPIRSPLYAWQGFTGSVIASNDSCAYLTQDNNGQIWCQIDLGKKEIVNGFRVMPEQAKDSANGFAFGTYDVLVSLDGENFETILQIAGDSFDYNSVGEFYTKMFPENVRARYIKWVFYKYVVNSGFTYNVTNNVFQNMQLSKREDAT